MIVLKILQYIFLIYLGFSSLYILVFSFAGLFRLKAKSRTAESLNKFAVLIPAYKEDEVILEVAEEATKQNYPPEKFDVIVIADSFQPQTIRALQSLPVTLLEVSFEKSTKSKALNAAMHEMGDEYDVAVVLDADNIMEADFLQKMNAAFKKDNIAVQGHRVAKNTNTSFALLDAISEEINNHIFRHGHRVLGMSAALIGSGMGIRYNYFKQMMQSIDAVGGFDKEIELKLLRERHLIEYLPDAFVYDEKVQKAEVFQNQRRRWLSAQLHYFSKDIFKATWHLISRGNLDYFDKAIQLIQPPRVMLMGLLMFLSLISIIVNPLVFTIIWLGILLACIMALLFATPGRFYNPKTLGALATLPRALGLMFLSLMKLRGANREFIHTEHISSKEDLNQ